MLAGMALFGLALVAFGGPAQEPRGGVLLNPDPPEAPRWGLEWELWERPSPSVAETPAPGAVSASADPASVQEAPAWDPDAPAGIWATPAEFADSN